MIQEHIDTIRLLGYPDERIRARLLSNQLVPFLDDGDIFYAAPVREGALKVSRMKAIPFHELKVPTLTPRQFEVHQEYLKTLTELCPRFGDIADIMGVRTTRLRPIFRRYEVPLSKYRLSDKPPYPEHIDLDEFRELYEEEAYTLKELSEHYDITLGKARRVIDDQEFVAPIDAVKTKKRLERNPQYLEVGGKKLPPPTPVQLEKAIEDGHDTVERLSVLFEVNPRTMTGWLDHHGIETAGMRSRRKNADIPNLHEIVYQEVILKGRKVPEVAKEKGLDRGKVWRTARDFPEWNEISTRTKTIPNDMLGRLYHAVKGKRMLKKEACARAGVSHKTLDREFVRYETERAAMKR